MALAAATGLTSPALAQTETVTFQQVLERPNDLRLNLRYAQQRTDAGDLLSAAAALERLLFVEPNWDRARLMYAGVLYRLGDYTAAQREIELLEGRDLSDSALSELDAYKRRTASKVGRTRVSGRLSVGAAYDDNAGSLISEDGLIAADTVDQWSFVGRGALDVVHALGESQSVKAFVHLDGYYKKFEDDEFDGFSILNGKAGFRGTLGVIDWTANLSGRDVMVRGDRYLTEYGGQFSLHHDITARTGLTVSYGIHEQQYESVFDGGDSFAELRDGMRYDAGLRVAHAFSPRLRGSVGVGYRDKTADLDDFAYDFYALTGGLDAFLPKAAYIDTDLIYRDYSYDGIREDEFLYGRAAVGIPLSSLFRTAAGGFASGLSIELAVNHTDRSSNVELFDFESTGGTARLIWRFGG
jgi:hypothetical protein